MQKHCSVKTIGLVQSLYFHKEKVEKALFGNNDTGDMKL